MQSTLRTVILAGLAVCVGPDTHAAQARFIPSAGAEAYGPGTARTDFDYDPTSAYDQKGLSQPRGFASEAPSELIDPFSGNLILRFVDLKLPGVAGLDLNLVRVYNSKIHRNYAKRLAGDVNGLFFVLPSPVGLGWTMHLGRLVGASSTGPNSGLTGPRYYERSDGSQHPFFAYGGPNCGDGKEMCLLTRAKDNPYLADANQPWHVATIDGQNITFGHQATNLDVQNPGPVHYATLIRDAHGNQIQIFYHDDTIVIGGTTYQYEYLRHFIDRIVDSAGRQIVFGYAVVNPGVIRLSSITAGNRTYRYFYSGVNPWQQTQAFLTQAQPPEGARWLYDYAGLDDGTCADSSKRWCELTHVTYPQGGTLDYTFGDEVFWAQSNPMSVRAVRQRVAGGREIASGTWSYDFNRAANYTGDEHTIITRPGGAREVYTYFGVGNGAYSPQGGAWKAGVLLKKRVRDASGNELQAETYEWVPSQAISDESFGDYFIGFDTGIFVPQLRTLTTQRGTLRWTTTNTSFNHLDNSPRCTTEEASDGTRRYRLQFPEVIDVPGQNIHFWNLQAASLLSYNPPTAANCDENQISQIQAAAGDELVIHTYGSTGQLTRQRVNGTTTDFRYNGDGTLQAQIRYQGVQNAELTDGHCTTFGDHQYGVARQTVHGADAPNCTGGAYTEERTVDWFGSVTSSTNGAGHTREFIYDGLGRAKEIRPPGETPIQITFQDVGGFTAMRRITQGSFWLETRYDGFGRKTETRTVAGDIVQRRLDAFGRVVFGSLPAERVEDLVGDTFTYDDLGRILSVTHADGSLARYSYGTSAHSVTVTDESSRDTIQTLRAFGAPEPTKLVRIQLPGEPAPTSDTYTYLVDGRLTRANFAGRQRVIDYAFSKKPIHEYTPEGGHVYFGYDPAGNLRCRDRRGQTHCSDANFDDEQAEVRYVVDEAERISQALYADDSTPDVSFTYDASNNLATISDGAGTRTFTYTLADRLAQQESEIGGVSYTTGYGYNVQGLLETLTYPSGRVLTYGYDTANRITSVRDAVNTYINHISYHANGRPRSVTYGNGVVTTTSLDPLQRPDVLNGSGILQLDYDYDAAGNIESIVDGIRPENSIALRYDDLDRLEHAGGPWGNIDYTYNAAGDRLTESIDGSTTTFTYDGLGRLNNLSGALARVFAHDPFGNQIQRADSSLMNVMNYTYDLENRMTDVSKSSIAGGSSPVASFVYDGRGQRVISRHGGQCDGVVDHYDQQGGRIAQSTESGLTLKELVIADGVTVAELDARPVVASPDRIDFGNAEPGNRVTRTVTLQNRTAQPFVIQTMTASSGFQLLTPLPITIPEAGPSGPGSRIISVAFQPGAAGPYGGSLSSCDQGFFLQLPLAGIGGSARADLDVRSFDFGDLSYGVVQTRTVTVTNSGSLPLVITDWESNRGGVSIVPSSDVSIPPGGQQQFTVRLDTTHSCGGNLHAIVLLRSNSTNYPVAHRIDVNVRVRALELASTEHSSGAVAVGSEHLFEVPVRNLADVPVTVSLSLSGAPQFRLDSVSPIELEPDEAVSLHVRYRPTQGQWSPFGDHASLRVRFPHCIDGCGADGTGFPDVHLAGNIASEIVPRGGRAPFMAVRGDVVHLVSMLQSPVEHNYVQRSAAGAWSTPIHPAQMPTGVPPKFLLGPDGRITFRYNLTSSLEQVFVQRHPDGSFGQPCTAPHLWGEVSMATDTQGNTWVLRRSLSDPARIEFGPILSAQGQCLSSQSPPIAFEDEEHWSYEGLLTPGPPGIVHLVGWHNEVAPSAFDTIHIATLNMTTGSVDMEVYTPPGRFDVAYPVMEEDSDGVWHLIYFANTVYSVETRVEELGLFYVTRSAAGIWGTPRLIVDHAGKLSSGEHPRLALDGRGGVHVACISGACRSSYTYATKPPGGPWQVSQAVYATSARDVSSPFEGLALAADGDRVVAAWISQAFNAGNGVLTFGQIDLGEAGPSIPAPISVWEDTISDGESPQKHFSVGSGPGQVQIEFSLTETTRSVCLAELLVRRPDAIEIGRYLIDTRKRATLLQAMAGVWTLQVQSSGGCVAQPFHVEVSLNGQAGQVLGAAGWGFLVSLLLAGTLLFRRRAIRAAARSASGLQ